MRVLCLAIFMVLAYSASPDTDEASDYQLVGQATFNGTTLQASLHIADSRGGIIAMPSVSALPGQAAELHLADPNGQFTVSLTYKMSPDGSGCIATGSIVDAAGVGHPLYLEMSSKGEEDE